MAPRTKEWTGRCAVKRRFHTVRQRTNKQSPLSFSFTGTKQFRHTSPTARNRLLHLQAAVTNSKASATTSGYQKFGTRTWNRLITFLKSISIDNDPFLISFTPHHRSEIIGLFAQSLRSSTNGSTQGSMLMAEGSIQNSLSVLAQTFLENNVPDPRMDGNGKTTLSLKRLLASFKLFDANKHRQKAIPVSVIKKVHKLYNESSYPLARACTQLIIGAFFFAMPSCEYSKTTSPSESRVTHILTIGNIRFFKNQSLISHNNPDLSSADIVSITFISQKNKEKHQTISMHRSGHPYLCPVHAWATIVQRIKSNPAATDHTPVNTYITKTGRLSYILSTNIRTKLHSAAAAALSSLFRNPTAN